MGYILIADDDLAIAELISDTLEDEGYETRIVSNGEKVLEAAHLDPSSIDLLLLDIMMPKLDGLQVCKELRNLLDIPIVFISAKSSNQSLILGLDVGADDYITKPFLVDELVARVNAHIRREKRKKSTQYSLIDLGDVLINKEMETVLWNQNPVELSTREYQVLLYLAENVGKTLSREQIFEAVWQTSFGDLNSVTMHIKNLRSKLDPNNELIRTVWGIGYKLVRRCPSCH